MYIFKYKSEVYQETWQRPKKLIRDDHVHKTPPPIVLECSRVRSNNRFSCNCGYGPIQPSRATPLKWLGLACLTFGVRLTTDSVSEFQHSLSHTNPSWLAVCVYMRSLSILEASPPAVAWLLKLLPPYNLTFSVTTENINK